MQELELLQQKLKQLLDLYSASKAENEVLRRKLSQQESNLKQQQALINTHEQALKLKSVADAAKQSASHEQLSQHIDAVIKLIDQNIAKL